MTPKPSGPTQGTPVDAPGSTQQSGTTAPDPRNSGDVAQRAKALAWTLATRAEPQPPGTSIAQAIAEPSDGTEPDAAHVLSLALLEMADIVENLLVILDFMGAGGAVRTRNAAALTRIAAAVARTR